MSIADENIARNLEHVKNVSYIIVNGQRYSGVDIADFDIMRDHKGIMILLTNGILHYHYNVSFEVAYKSQSSLIPNEK